MGFMTLKPQITKGKDNKGKLKQIDAPIKFVSVDQLEFRNSGYIGVLREFMTKQRYTYETGFVDHYSDFTFTYIQRLLSIEDIIKANFLNRSQEDMV